MGDNILVFVYFDHYWGRTARVPPSGLGYCYSIRIISTALPSSTPPSRIPPKSENESTCFVECCAI